MPVTGTMKRDRTPDTFNTENGHLAVQVEGLHAPAPAFSFEHRQSGLGLGASLAAHALFIVVGVLIYLYAPEPSISGPVTLDLPSDKIVWLAEAGPGGGGGGGGNRSPEPPKEAELPGKDAISVPVERPDPPQPPQPPKPEPLPEPEFNIPAKTLGASTEIAPGLIDSGGPVEALSQGTGSGGGAGSGEGTGIGPGKGSGLGPGEGGGTGGGVYRPGNGVELPQVLRQVRPQYTADAMRAKVQGTVVLDCVVLPDGSVGNVTVTRSLDPVFGLDQEAIKAARQWRFIPGTRFGKPVPVLVQIELTFTLR